MAWQGKILRVNLTSGICASEALNQQWAEDYIGQRGLGVKYLSAEVDPKVNPLAPENKLIIATGPLTGTAAPTGGRSSAITKGALTGTITCSNTGGYFGAELRFAGYDLLIVEGRAATPVFLSILDDVVTLQPADDLWGRSVWETEDEVRRRIGEAGVKVASIGRAGETGVLFACIVNDKDRAFGRSGVGAVMGSKNLKAIAVRGSQGTAAVDPTAFAAAVRVASERLAGSAGREQLTRFGTHPMLDVTNNFGALPTRNCRDVQFEGSHHVNADAAHTPRRSDGQATFFANKACFACTIGCGRVWRIDPQHFTLKDRPEQARYRDPSGGLEYESAFAFTSMAGVDDLDAATYVNFLCNEHSMDPISLGATISAAMELFEEGVITTEDTGGLELRFGNARAMVEAAELTAHGEGFGKLLGLGAKRLCEHFGRPELAMVVKGQEFPGYDPRAMQGMGLAYATSPRGACHMRASPYGADFSKTDTVGKPAVVKSTQDWGAVIDSTGLCAFATGDLKPEQTAALVAGACGPRYTAEELRLIGERIFNLERLFNNAAGFTRADDTLPHRDLAEPVPSGTAKGIVCQLDVMLPEYYELRGWTQDGEPTTQTQQRLGLAAR